MKGKIISETIYEDWLTFSNAIKGEIKHIIIPEADNLAITFHDKELYVITGFKEEGEDFKVLKEIEVPDEFVKKAMAFLKTKEELTCETETLLGEFLEEGEEENS